MELNTLKEDEEKWKTKIMEILSTNLELPESEYLVSEIIENIEKKWKGKKTNEIVDFTHKQLPYLYAEDNEVVSYGLFTQEDPDEIY